MEQQSYTTYLDSNSFENLEVPAGSANEDKRCTLFDKPSFVSEHADDSREEILVVPVTDSVYMNKNLHDMQHDEDPRDVIMKKIGDISGVRLSGAQVLVATYIRPEKKKSGLIITSSVREEDKFQGKCGLVLKMGPLAYKETEKLDFGGYSVKEKDWVWYRPMDGYALSVNGVHCRVLDDVEIKGDLDHPDTVL